MSDIASETPGGSASSTDVGEAATVISGGSGDTDDAATPASGTAADDAGRNAGGNAGASTTDTAGRSAGTNASSNAGGNAGSNAGHDAGGNASGSAESTASGSASRPADDNGRPDVSEFDPRAQAYIRRLVKENGDNRIRAKESEDRRTAEAEEHAGRLQKFLDGFAQVMGLTADAPDEPPKTVEEATKRWEESKAAFEGKAAEHRQALVRLAVWETAGGLGANVPALTDSASFLAKLDALDPTADGFRDQLTRLVAAQVDSDPTRFKTQAPKPAPVQSGGEFTGGSGGPQSDDDLSVEEHIRAVDPHAALRN